MKRSAVCWALFILGISAPRDVRSQETLLSVRGRVQNESGHPIEQAQVLLYVNAAPRDVRTDQDGRFSFIGVPRGERRLRVLRIGFQPHDTTVTVGDSSVVVDIQLRRLTTLREVEIVARRTGVYGTVMGRDSLKPLDGARVELLGARVRDTTDADGAFNLPTEMVGTFMLRISHRYHDTRVISVRVPKDTAVGIDIVLKPGTSLLDAHMEGLWMDMAQRINWKGVNAAVVGRDELVKLGSDLQMALRFAPSSARKGIFIDEGACIYVDGVARPYATIKDFDVDHIESIEIYPFGSELSQNLRWRWPAKMPCGIPFGQRAPRGALRAQEIVIRTRR